MGTTGGFTSAGLSAVAEQLVLDSFTLADAIALGEIANAYAVERALPIVIEVRHGDRVAYRAARPGTTADNDEWLRRKFAVVRRFAESTMAVRVRYEERGTDFNAATGLAEADYAAHGGGWPIVVHGVGMVGLFGISGLPQVADHELLVECLTALRNRH